MDDDLSITLCALFYGDYPQLARRCLESFAPLWQNGLVRLRIGANAVSAATMAALEPALAVAEHAVISPVNLCKYPVMWRLFHERPLETGLVMWSDDDSYLRLPPAEAPAWLDRLRAAMTGHAMVGGRFFLRPGLSRNQQAWVASRPWCKGLPPLGRGQLQYFITGGWWCLRTAVVREHGWPDVEINHRGGDVMLGELLRQQGLRMRDFMDGLAVNANAEGRSHKSPRRGLDEAPVGSNYHGQVDVTLAARQPRQNKRR